MRKKTINLNIPKILKVLNSKNNFSNWYVSREITTSLKLSGACAVSFLEHKSFKPSTTA